jgi:hypothetical protein
MTKFFRFDIPARLGYSPDWFGIMDKCPRDTKVLLYNDKDEYGIAVTEDIYIPKEVKVIDEEEALGAMTEVSLRRTQTDLYYGKKLYDRWKIVEVVEDLPEGFDSGFGEALNG